MSTLTVQNLSNINNIIGSNLVISGTLIANSFQFNNLVSTNNIIANTITVTTLSYATFSANNVASNNITANTITGLKTTTANNLYINLSLYDALNLNGDGGQYLSSNGTSPIWANISGSQVVTALGYTPVQQGTGTNQLANLVKIGWSGTNLLLQVDTTNFNTSWPINSTGFTSTSQNSQFNSLGVGTAGSGTTGQIRATNDITAFYSDKRLKKNIIAITNPLEKIGMISGVTYNSNDVAASFGYIDTSEQVGVIAQEVQQILPQIVKPAPFDIGVDSDNNEYSLSGENYLTVQYEKIIPLLIEAIKELKAEVDLLKGK